MRTVALSVRELIERDPVAYEALGRGVLNANAYARSIQDRVQERCFKDIKINTIVTSLLRFADEIAGQETLVPEFKMEAITVKVGLTEVAYTKGERSAAVIKWLQKQPRSTNEFFLITEGNNEVDLIFPQRLFPGLKKAYPAKQGMNGSIPNLAAITLSYPSTLTFVPNVGYTLMRSLALKHINVVEVISSYSEVSFLVAQQDIEPSLDALKAFL